MVRIGTASHARNPAQSTPLITPLDGTTDRRHLVTGAAAGFRNLLHGQVQVTPHLAHVRLAPAGVQTPPVLQLQVGDAGGTGDGPEQPLIARGGVGVTGSMDLVNKYTDSVAWMGGTSAVGTTSSSATTWIADPADPPITDPADPNYDQAAITGTGSGNTPIRDNAIPVSGKEAGKGNGLGLMVASRIVGDHGGSDADRKYAASLRQLAERYGRASRSSG